MTQSTGGERMRNVESQAAPRAELYTAQLMGLTGLRGLFPMTAIGPTGAVADMSGLNQSLTYNGNPTLNYAGLAPYIDLDGTGDYLSRASSAYNQITGLETYIAPAVRGITFGGWFWFNSVVGRQALMGKWNTAGAVNQRSYLLVLYGTTIYMDISVTGTAGTHYTVQSTVAATIDNWHFIEGRLDPSTSLDINVNGIITSDTIQAPFVPSIHNGTARFEIGSSDTGAQNLNGRASMCHLNAAYLDNNIWSAMRQQSRPMFGV